jgi:hypothetical protein
MVPAFETKRLFLRPISLAMSENYEKHFVNYEDISQLSAAVPWPYPKNGVAEYLESVKKKKRAPA